MRARSLHLPHWFTAAVTAAFLCAPSALLAADAPDSNEACLMCHGDAAAKNDAGKSIAVDAKVFASSVHGQMGFKCTDCHTDTSVDKLPHEPKLKAADCSSCHEATVKEYLATAHAKARAGGNQVAATCSSCHGSHDIQKSSEPKSRTNAANVEATCAKCHGNDALIQQAHIPGGNIASQFHDSIHGRKLAAGGAQAGSAPNCISCHGAHKIVSPADPASRVNRANVAQMCGSCHQQVFSRFSQSQHGRMAQGGNSAAPTCIDCHTAHRVMDHTATAFQTSVINECGNCHVDFIKTYRDTYHGQVTQLGYARIATCASCHGAHEVLPASDPRSTISPENIVTTCRNCHPKANANFAQFRPHGNPHDPVGDPMLYWGRIFMQLLLAGVFGFFGLHTLLWAIRSGQEKRAQNGKGR